MLWLVLYRHWIGLRSGHYSSGATISNTWNKIAHAYESKWDYVFRRLLATVEYCELSIIRASLNDRNVSHGRPHQYGFHKAQAMERMCIVHIEDQPSWENALSFECPDPLLLTAEAAPIPLLEFPSYISTRKSIFWHSLISISVLPQIKLRKSNTPCTVFYRNSTCWGYNLIKDIESWRISFIF